MELSGMHFRSADIVREEDIGENPEVVE